jgi:hypothetical protein
MPSVPERPCDSVIAIRVVEIRRGSGSAVRSDVTIAPPGSNLYILKDLIRRFTWSENR